MFLKLKITKRLQHRLKNKMLTSNCFQQTCEILLYIYFLVQLKNICYFFILVTLDVNARYKRFYKCIGIDVIVYIEKLLRNLWNIGPIFRALLTFYSAD